MKDLDTVLDHYVTLGPEAKEIHYFGPFLFVQIPKPKSEFDPLAETVEGHLATISLAGDHVQPFVVDLMAKNEWTIGRWDGDIAIPHPAISRLHARLTRSDDGNFVIYDEASKNFSILDGQPVEAQNAHVLLDGARILFGPVRCTFYSGETFRKVIERVLEKRDG